MPAAEIQKIFNSERYYERVLAGELLASTEKSAPAPTQAGQPPGTMSERIWYFDRDLNRIALVHQYILPDGTIGASGRPDPKWLLVDGEIWIS